MNAETFKNKAENLAEKMNNLTKTLNVSDEMLIEGDDVIEFVESKTKNQELLKSDETYADIMNLSLMIDDFKFVRDTLKEVTENARRVQNSITMDLLDDDSDNKASLIVSFSELSKAITDAQKLYVLSYKEMSVTLLNLDKIKKAEKHNIDSGQSTGNTGNTYNSVNVYTNEPISTTDLIAKLKNKK